MATSNGTIYSALLAAQKEMGPLLKNATNPHFRNRYADLSAVIETISEPLNNAGLVFYQGINYDATNNVSVLTTVVADTKSGETLESHFPIVCKDPQNPQAIGGAITYLRRYSLMAMLGLAPEDDDGHAASQRPQPKQEPKAKPETASGVVRVPATDQIVDTTTGEIADDDDATRVAVMNALGKKDDTFDEEKEKTALMRHIFAAANDLGIDNDALKHQMWEVYGGKTKEAEFSRKNMTIDQLTHYRDRLVAKAKTVKGAVK